MTKEGIGKEEEVGLQIVLTHEDAIANMRGNAVMDNENPCADNSTETSLNTHVGSNLLWSRRD